MSPRPRQRVTVEALPRGLTQCPQCGIYFLPERSTAIFCSAACRRGAWLARKNADELTPPHP